MTSKILLVRQEAPPSPHPWRWLEVYSSIEGPRTRVCGGSWATVDEALAAMGERVAMMGGVEMPLEPPNE